MKNENNDNKPEYLNARKANKEQIEAIQHFSDVKTEEIIKKHSSEEEKKQLEVILRVVSMLKDAGIYFYFNPYFVSENEMGNKTYSTWSFNSLTDLATYDKMTERMTEESVKICYNINMSFLRFAIELMAKHLKGNITAGNLLNFISHCINYDLERMSKGEK